MLEEGWSLTQSEVETYFDGGRICKAYNGVRVRKRTDLQVCILLSLGHFLDVTQEITIEIASFPATANSVVWECEQCSLVLLSSVRTFMFLIETPVRTQI